MLICEFIYLIDFLIHFLLDYKPNTQKAETVRDNIKIIKRYVKGEMLKDLLPLIPLQFIHLKREQESFFLLIKFVRIEKIIDKFQVEIILSEVKKLQ
jgi:hypothetical protein